MAECYTDPKRKRRDFLHKLSNYYAREYLLVAVEDLDAKGLVELEDNSRNRAEAAWGAFLRMLEYKCEREGTHFVAVDPAGMTEECTTCGVSTDKPLWVRNTCARRAVSRRIEIGMQHGTFFLAVSGK